MSPKLWDENTHSLILRVGLLLCCPLESICRMVWLGAGAPGPFRKLSPALLVPEPGKGAMPVEWWPRLPTRHRERGKLLTKNLKTWTRICRKRQRHLKVVWVRCNFNRRNNGGENKGRKVLCGKRKYYTCMWREQAVKKIDCEWKGSSLDKANVVGKKRTRKLAHWQERRKRERGQFTKALILMQMRGELV